MVSYINSEFTKFFVFCLFSNNQIKFRLLSILENATMRHGYIKSDGFLYLPKMCSRAVCFYHHRVSLNCNMSLRSMTNLFQTSR